MAYAVSAQMKGFVAQLWAVMDLSIRRMRAPVSLRGDLDKRRQRPLWKRTAEVLTTPA